MASLAHVIRTFQSGVLSPNEFLAQIDQALATGPASCARMLAILEEEHTNFPLPPDVYVEVQRRIESMEQPKQGLNGDETRVQTSTGDRQNAPPAMPTGRSPSGEPERIKGVGDTLNGRFVLEECLGFGGMGMVYKALDLRKLEASDRKPYIAIKVLNVQFRGHPKSLIALQREAKKAQLLAHPNIVTVYDFDRDGSMVYLTMEYLSGKPLSQLLRAPDFKGMAYAQARPIVTGMAKALGYAHERGFVHCDLKPANVFLTDTGEVKVIDFGISRVFQKPEDAEATVFDPGSLGGMTPAYASPEMLEHREPDPRDDIYALGCITYELLTGRHPFERMPATQARNAGAKPQRPNNLSPRQWRALRGTLCFDRGDRTPTVASFLEGMSGGERRTKEYLVVAASVLVMAGLLAALVVNYGDDLMTGLGGEATLPEAPPASAEAPPAASEGPPAEVAQPAARPLSASAIAPILADVPCSALTASVRDDAVLVHGYLPGQFGIPRLQEMLGAVPGVGSLKLDVRQVRDDDCGVVTAFAPYWMKNREGGGATSIQTKERNAELSEGDSLIVGITTPAYQSYVHVDYYVLDGSVVHLVPSPRAKHNQAPPSYSATIGSPGKWVISKPFGSELVVLLVTPVPLFDGMRPEHESRSDYLRAVDQQLKRISAKYGPERISADILQITTRPKS